MAAPVSIVDREASRPNVETPAYLSTPQSVGLPDKYFRLGFLLSPPSALRSIYADEKG
jgi:hypothetical protein